MTGSATTATLAAPATPCRDRGLRQARKTAATVLSSVGLLAIIAAWVNGAKFMGTGTNGPSYGMAMAAALALLCYLTILFQPGRASARSQ